MDYLEALKILKIYGLDTILSDRDDPAFWAAALSKHWPLLDDPNINIDGLEFGIGEVDDTVPSKLKTFERWYFQRMDDNRLKVIPYKPLDNGQIRRTEEEFWSTVDNVTTEEAIKKLIQYYRSMGYPSITLIVTRPSKDEDKAIVFYAFAGAPNLGEGESRIWLHQADGNWQPSPEVLWSIRS